MRLRLYADGASGNKAGKPIGWGCIIVDATTWQPLFCGTGSLPAGTNNIAELSGIRDGLGRIWCGFSDFGDVRSIEVVSDSMYALGAASGLNAVHSNAELVAEIRKFVIDFQQHGIDVTFAWQRGHAGEEYQERCDRLAVAAKEKQKALAAENLLK